ncbi:MAG TPA: HEAT repeat domain-containing protein [Draconibacterium sp.]|nr:HEAT repeat domain-containing protein [Draconibacterium sp.]
MKRILLIIGASLTILFICAVLAIHIWIGHDVKENIKIAQSKYPGKAEDALIAFLSDTTNSPHDRTHLAIWTLGQIQSEKAVPILTALYKNDPEGKTCRGKHDEVLCQYEIYKALRAEEIKWWPLHRKLNK